MVDSDDAGGGVVFVLVLELVLELMPFVVFGGGFVGNGDVVVWWCC